MSDSTFNALAVAQVKQFVDMFKATIGEFSQQEMLVRPTPGANHATWQLGHLVRTTTDLLNAAVPDAAPELPAGFRERFTKETSKLDDPAAFPGKDELFGLFDRACTAAMSFAGSASSDDLAKPMPERMRAFVPTVGHLVFMLPSHIAMHLGQCQVIRRKLGKPILF